MKRVKMTIYAKYIDIPEWEKLKDQLIEFRLKYSNTEALWWCHFYNEVNEHIPDLINAFNSMGLTMNQLIYFTNLNNDINIDDSLDPRAVFIHTDREDDPESKYDKEPVLTNFNPTCAINIPLLNCERSKTLFYRFKKENTSDVYYKVIDCGGHSKTDVEEVYRFELYKPAVLRINVPHAVWNPNKEPRVVATFRFNESLENLFN